MLKKLLITVLMIMCCCAVNLAMAAESLRVGVVDNQSAVELVMDDDFRVAQGYGQHIMRKGKYFVHVKEGKLYFDDEHFFGSGARVLPAQGKSLQLNKRDYKGELTFIINDDKLTAINNVDLEAYLASVLPKKTMVVWPDEVIKAQVVAARSYALHAKLHNGQRDYDLKAHDVELNYEGTGPLIEKKAITKLIAATAGQYLIDGQGDYVWARTTSSTGGRSENYEGISYLQSVDDFDSDSPDYKWERVVTPSLLTNYLAQGEYNVGELRSLRLSPQEEPENDRTATGRVEYIMLNGSEGSKKLSGDQLQQILDLPSTLFDIRVGQVAPDKLNVPIENRYGIQIGSKDIDINTTIDDNKPSWNNMLKSYHMLSGNANEKIIFTGHGKGSGLGLSAWGARGLTIAKPKTTYKDILAYYYPGTRLVK